MTVNPKRLGFALPYLGLALLICLMVPSQAVAQTLYGSLTGTVTDETAAVIPGADVQVINQETNNIQRTVTNDTGRYQFTTLPPGRFTLIVQMPGFREYRQTDVPVAVNNLHRANVRLQIGQVAETITVTSETAVLQTDTAEVKTGLEAQQLSELPVPIGRNYQELFKTLPGFEPPRQAHSIQTNPARSRQFNVNTVSASINTTRIDGITTTNPWLPHITGYVPTLDAIETVNVTTNSFDAEQGLAGGAAVTVQMKSGTNDFHGTAFFVGAYNPLMAKRFLYPYPEGLRQGKYIYNQWGLSGGGPIVKDKVFFFASYEGMSNRRFANRIGSVATATTRSGDFNNLGVDIYDPLTGDENAFGRTQFPNNTIPQDRLDPINQNVINGFGKYPLPNIGDDEFDESNNYLGEGNFEWSRFTLDTKVDWMINDSVNMFGRFSALDYSVVQPAIFGLDNLAGDGLDSGGFESGNVGIGQGTTYTFGAGANWVISPTLVLDGNVGYAEFVTDSQPPYITQNVGLELGIPGTNGAKWYQSGMPAWDMEGYNDIGTLQYYMPYLRTDKNTQFTVNTNWTSAAHNVRWGVDISLQQMNHNQAEGGVGQGSKGRFRFDNDATRACLGDSTDDCSLSDTTSRQSFAAFLLGTPSRIGKNYLADPIPYSTRNNLFGLYVRDRWQIKQNVTLSIGTRWEYYPMVTRANRGVERYNPSINMMSVCGVGSVPTDCGAQMSKLLFAPRIGIAYRISDTFVLRAGYGITIDPYPLARDIRTNYPMFIENDLRGEHNWNPAITSMDQGIPLITDPDYGNGIIDIPTDVFASTFYLDFQRGYIQSWNLTLQKELFYGFTGEVGYVANRSIRGFGRRDLNYGELGGGSSSQQLVKAFGRNAGTSTTDNVGHGQYDSMQARLTRRFSGGWAVGAAYTLAKGMSAAVAGNISDATMLISIPELFDLTRQLNGVDRRHNFQVTSIWELPFGPGKSMLTDGAGAAILGGWQVNNIISWYTGTPFNVGGSSPDCGSGCTGRADIVGPIKQLNGRGPGTPYFVQSSFLRAPDDTIGTAAYGILWSPRTFNWDFSIFRDFPITERVGLKFTADFFNFLNHPQYGPDNDSFASTTAEEDDFLEIDEGVNARQMRFGLRLEF
ncbi:MAG TPA: TonB-dependent receptor [Acidobacteriota bacterium]|nr:TonB-dependent receptor [Acidobacteriota bacterium]